MKKKVLFFIDSLRGGGAEKVLLTLLRHFDYERYDVTVLTVIDEEFDRSYIAGCHVQYRTIIPANQNAIAKIWYRIKYKLIYKILPANLVSKVIIPSGFDTYIAFVEGYNTKIIGHFPSKCKKIAYVHIDLKNYPWTLLRGIYKSLEDEKKTYAQFDRVVCVSRSVEKVMREYYGLMNTTTIYNPIDVAYILEKAGESVDVVLSEGINIVSVGRLVPQKGYDLLIPIVARLHNDGCNVSLYIIGKGDEYRKLEGLICNERAQDYIHLLGYHNNPHAIVSKMDLFVCSSRAEGYSLVIAEALTMGIPVVSTACSGPNELLENGKYGVLCTDYDDLYQQLQNIVMKPALLKALHQKALQRRSSFNVETATSRLYNMI